MKILNRYIIKEHIGPFFFALSVIMFILLMNFLVKYIGQIFGKGLSTFTILKLIALNLSWMLALAVPMATLVAVLMAFGRFSADNEITILKSSGISIYRIIRPSLYLGLALTAVMIYFNDQILPESNHRAKVLFRAIREKKPTLQLEENIIYELGKYTFSVKGIEKTLPEEWLSLSNLLGPEYRTHQDLDRLRQVTIFDRSNPSKDVTIVAKQGYMVYSAARLAVVFTLFDGQYHELDNSRPSEYQRSSFSRHTVIIPAKEFMFEERSDTDRSDREMNIKMMQEKVDSFREQVNIRLQKIGDIADKNFIYADTLLARWQATPDSVRRDTTLMARIDPNKMLQASRKAHRVAERYYQQIRTNQSFLENQEKSINKFMVEIHKKISIPFACIVFVLVGAPLGVMARRGSMGVAISLSIGFFLLYWVFLIGGEDLADRRFMTPFMAMWAPNIIVGLAGIYLTYRAVKESSFINWDRLKTVFKRSRNRIIQQPGDHL